jgi:hypothetical protein
MLDSIYDCNIDACQQKSIGDLVMKTMELSWSIEEWSGSLSPLHILNSAVNFQLWSAATFENERYSIILSIHLHRTILLSRGPLLVYVLERSSDHDLKTSSSLQNDTIRSLLRLDLSAVQSLYHIISGILEYDPSFLRVNAAWWMCNYAGESCPSLKRVNN